MDTSPDDQPSVRDIAGGVRDLLRGTGANTDSKWVRGLRQARESNVLFAAALHAAERHAQGLPLTELEQGMVETMGSIMADAEIRAVGAEYRAAVRDLGEVPLLPRVVTSMPASRGFTVDDYVEHLQVVHEQNAGRANCALVDVAAVAEGTPLDSDAFKAAVDDVGFGSTAVLGAPPEEPDPAEPEAPAYTARFEFESFTCRREVGDGLSGRDEIYFTAAARSDKYLAPTYQSQEFSGVEKGETHPFSSGRKVVFAGDAGDYVTLFVQTWEADHSNSDWYDKLHDALRAWLDRPWWVQVTQAAVQGTVGGLPGMILDAIDTVIHFFVNFKESFRNKDDLSCQRGFVFDRTALVTLYHAKDDVWEFNGDGHHTLRVKYTGEHPKFRNGVVQYVTVRDRDKPASMPVSLGWRSATPPALFSFGGKLHCLYVRPDQTIMWSTKNEHQWARPQPMRAGFSTYFRPAMGRLLTQGKLFAAITAKNGQVVLSTYTDGTGWSASAPVPHSTTERAPSAATHGMLGGLAWVLDVTHRTAGADIRRKYTADGINWKPDHIADAAPWEFKTDHAFSTTNYGANQLWFAWRSLHDGKLHVGYRESDLHDGHQEIASCHADRIDDGPAIETHLGTLWVAVRSPDKSLHLYPGHIDGWDHTNRKTITAGSLEGEPTLASHGGHLYLAYRRP